MKYMLQFALILLISALGELLSAVVPLPVPAGIYGMGMLFVCLWLGIIPLDAVRGTGKYLLDVMPVMFVPAAVGLMSCWNDLRAMLVPALAAIVPLTLCIMAAAGGVTQRLVGGHKKKEQ